MKRTSALSAWSRATRSASTSYRTRWVDSWVQGLLTATLPSKIGDTLRCEVKIDRLDGPPSRLRLALSWACTNQEGTLVMSGGSEGVILQPSDPSASVDGGSESRDG